VTLTIEERVVGRGSCRAHFNIPEGLHLSSPVHVAPLQGSNLGSAGASTYPHVSADNSIRCDRLTLKEWYHRRLLWEVKNQKLNSVSGEPGRKHPASGVRIFAGKPTFVLLTVCTKDRRGWLACDEAHDLLKLIWYAADKWLVGHYVLMPDHLHCLAAPHDVSFPFDPWVTYWKSQFSKGHAHEHSRWQTDAHHHRLRDGENYSEKWWYVRNNPVRHGLVENAEDWPYQGMIHDIRWA